MGYLNDIAECYRQYRIAKLRVEHYRRVQNLNTTNDKRKGEMSYRVVILRPGKTPDKVTLTPRFKTELEANQYGFFRADDYDFRLEECIGAANCVLRDNKLVYVS